ncbi:ankyrin repeat domain-containing protein [Puia sp.]|uniref:ankyrin repeat domain-containing protein n=1 Tax=Puia sp. TaxID=2045100 RepID=UPI002F41272C
MTNNDISDARFQEAVQAIDSGDISGLRHILERDPSLVVKRLERPADGYFARPYLLWFVADNPIRHEKLPANIVAIAEMIIEAMQKGGDEHYQFILDYTLGLVCTGRIPKECKVQIPLMELLVKQGAAVRGSVLGPIGQRNFEAANWLLGKGADYNLATAVGLGDVENAKRLVPHSTPSERYVALVVAAFFGRADVVALLIDAGLDVNGGGTSADFNGFHSHASALHQAVYSGSLDSVKRLVEAGASLTATDKAYQGTPLDWARHMQTEAGIDEGERKNYAVIESYLREPA